MWIRNWKISGLESSPVMKIVAFLDINLSISSSIELYFLNLVSSSGFLDGLCDDYF